MLIDMFAKCGDVDKALNLFRSMRARNTFSWTSVIGGLALRGRGVEVVEVGWPRMLLCLLDCFQLVVIPS